LTWVISTITLAVLLINGRKESLTSGTYLAPSSARKERREDVSKNTMYAIPRYGSLDGAIEILTGLEGLTLTTLSPCDVVHVTTHNSHYELFMLDPAAGKVLIRGGSQFKDPEEASVIGSTFGGCMLKMSWLGVGLRMEINAGGRRVVTSPVQSLIVENHSNTHIKPEVLADSKDLWRGTSGRVPLEV